MTEMIVISAATPRHTPSIDIQLMNETKNPRPRVRTYRSPRKMGSGWNIGGLWKGRKATGPTDRMHLPALVQIGSR